MLRTRLGLGCGSDSESQAVTALSPEEALLGPNSPPPTTHTALPMLSMPARLQREGEPAAQRQPGTTLE